MGIRFYDEALANKIQGWIRDPRLRILKPNEVQRLFQIAADVSDDKPITLPLIAIGRDTAVNIDVSTKRNLTFDGVKLEVTPEQSGTPAFEKVLHLDAVPVTINYQIDIYTKRYDEGDEYLRNFIFQIINHPKMMVNIPYNGANIEHTCYLRLMQTVNDNSDIQQKLFPDQFTRWTLNVRLDGAYLFSTPISEPTQIVEGTLKYAGETNKEQIFVKTVE